MGHRALLSESETVWPKLLRTMERSVRSMESAPSKLPSDLSRLVLPKLLRTVGEVGEVDDAVAVGVAGEVDV